MRFAFHNEKTSHTSKNKASQSGRYAESQTNGDGNRDTESGERKKFTKKTMNTEERERERMGNENQP